MAVLEYMGLKIKIEEIIDIEKLQKIQDAFSDIFEIPAIIYDKDGKAITTPSGFSQFCSYIRESEKGLEKCQAFEAKLVEELKHSNSPVCRKGCTFNNMVTITIPIKIDNLHIGNFGVGQMVDQNLDYNELLALSEELDLDLEKLVKYSKELVKFDGSKHDKTIKFMSLVTEQISELILKNLKNRHLIHNLKKHEEELTKSRQEAETNQNKFETIINVLPQLVSYLNKDLIYEYANDTYLKKLQVNIEDIIGKKLVDIVGEDTFKKALPQIQRVLSGETVRYLNKFTYPNGQTFDIEGTLIPKFDDLGQVEGYYAILNDLSELISAQNQIAESQEKYKLIAENTSDGIIVFDAESNLIYASPAYENMFPNASQSHIGINAETIYQMIHPDDRDPLFAKIYKAIADKQKELLYTYRLLKADNTIMWREDHAKFIYDKDGNLLNSYVICRDITERKNAEENIRKLQKAIESIKASIVITNTEGVIEYANQYFCNQTGYNLDEIVNNKAIMFREEIFPDEYYSNMWNTIRSNKTWEGELCNKKKSGEIYWEYAVISPITDSSNIITHFIAIKNDITENKKISEELLKAKNKAEENEKLKTAFLQNMSHEIRTPLNSILGFATLLNHEELSREEIKEYTAIINRSGNRLIELINNILEISKIQTGIVNINNHHFCIKSLFADLFDKFQPYAAEKNINILYSSNINLYEAYLFADESKIFEIFNILMSNAIKFTNEGEIRYGAEFDELGVMFYVKDTGVGIPAEKYESIFDKFVQAESSISRAYEGAGLGLAIAKGLVELMGGKIWVESEENSGTIFYFNLPQETNNQNKVLINSELNKEEIKELVGKRILVVEDEILNLEYLSRYLSKYGIDVIEASNGVKAVELLEKIESIDLVLMDIKMPVMNGYDALKLIKLRYPDMPIIAQTAYALNNESNRIVEMGFDNYIAKPIRGIDLIELIKRYL